jgi:hypothetical protein
LAITPDPIDVIARLDRAIRTLGRCSLDRPVKPGDDNEKRVSTQAKNAPTTAGEWDVPRSAVRRHRAAPGNDRV